MDVRMLASVEKLSAGKNTDWKYIARESFS